MDYRIPLSKQLFKIEYNNYDYETKYPERIYTTE